VKVGASRRSLLALAAGAAAASLVRPPAARAQHTGKVVRIGFLSTASAAGLADRVTAFRQGLRDVGYVEGANATIEYRWAEGHYDRLPDLAAELVHSNVDVIVTHSTPGSLAAKAATTTIPVVVAAAGDLVATGIVASLARPGGNVTGLSFFNAELRAKRIELLKEAMPSLTRVAVLLNRDNSANMGPELQAIEAAARTLKITLQLLPLLRSDEFASAFLKMNENHTDAVEMSEDALFTGNAAAIVALAAKHRLPLIGPKEAVQAGGLMSYGVDLPAMYYRAGAIVDKILKGATPADLPIERATKFEFILNLKAAKAGGGARPTAMLLGGDAVIE